MIKKSIVFAVILLVVYGAIIGLLGDSIAPSGESYDGNEQANRKRLSSECCDIQECHSRLGRLVRS